MLEPLKFVWDGEAFRPASYWWGKRAAIQFGAGEVVDLIRWEDRSIASHNHEFAWIKAAWDNLPDHLSGQFPSPDHLRKQALIHTGHCTMMQYPCGTQAEAERWAQNLRPMHPYSVVDVKGAIVTVYTAMSQSMQVMGKAEFQKSKDDIMRWVADLLQVDPLTLGAQEEAP